MTKAPSQKEFFENWQSYNDDLNKVQGLVYRQAETLINARISGKRVVDVGNGGLFNYDIAKSNHVVAVDLYPVPQLDQHKNLTYQVGRSDRLPLEKSSSDLVIWQNLMHHMIEDSKGNPEPMLKASLAEAFRVLSSDGEIIIVETYCNHFLYRLQGLLFPITRLVLSFIKHPLVRLLSKRRVRELLLESGFEICEETEIQKDRFMILLGAPVPTRLLPLRIFCLRARRVK